MVQGVAALLGERVKGSLRMGEPMKRHTSLRVGGPAELFVSATCPEDVVACMDAAREGSLPVTVIGGGTNALVADEGVRGIVVHIGRPMGYLEWRERGVAAGAGASLPALASQAAERGLAGAEFAVGIPGTVGGGVVMNAGVHDADMAGIVRRAQVVDAGARVRWLAATELDYGYRSSMLQTKQRWVVTAADLELQPDNPAEIRARMQQHLDNRRRTQPMGTHNCGSIFKNPTGDFAGRLVEAAGCKGLRCGGAEVSPVHANFIVNRGAATARDVLGLIREVRTRVRRAYGVELQLEMRLMGFPADFDGI